MIQPYEWLLIPAVGTFLVATFGARAAMQRRFDAAGLALFSTVLTLIASTAAALLLAPCDSLDQLRRPAAIIIAMVGGIGGGAGTCFTYVALRQKATGPVTTIVSMSILVPIVLAFLGGWDSAASTGWNLLGVILAIAGTSVIHLGRTADRADERFHWSGLALAAMLCFGVSQAAQKYITVVDPLPAGQPRYGFMVVYNLTASLALLAYLLKAGQRFQWRAWPFGLALAAASFFQFVCMLVLLQHVNTALVYITFTGGGIILVLLISTLMLGERYRPIVWVGCILGIAGIVLVRI